MSTPNVIVYPQTNNIVISAGTTEETITSTYSVNVVSFPSANIISTTNNPGISTISPNQAPISSNDSGSAGELRWDTNYLYVCVTNNLWKKIPLNNI